MLRAQKHKRVALKLVETISENVECRMHINELYRLYMKLQSNILTQFSGWNHISIIQNDV